MKESKFELLKFYQNWNVNNWETIRAKYMNLHTSRRQFYALPARFATFFSYFKMFKSDGGLNVIIKVWIVKILSNFKRK